MERDLFQEAGIEFTPTVTGRDLFEEAGIKYEPSTRTPFAVANDTVIEAANAVAGGVGSIANFVSPGNRVSRFIDENIIKPGEQSQSDSVKAEKQQFASDIAAADGFMDEAKIAAKYAATNPLLSAAQAAGSFALPLGAVSSAGRAAKALKYGDEAVKRFALGGGAVAGAALSGGDAAGNAYELSKQGGATEEQAVDAARQASVIPAIVGGAGGLVGAERLVAGAKGFAGNAASRALKTGAVEATQEGFEEGITQFEGQRAAVPYNPALNPMKGVGAAATTGAILGAATGGTLAALTPNTEVSFTPPDSITRQAGLPEIVVPIKEQPTNVSTRDALGPLAAEGGQPVGNQPSPSVGTERLGVDAGIRGGSDSAGIVEPVDGAPASIRNASGQPIAVVTGDPLSRANDADLLARAMAQAPVEAPQADQSQPVTIWTGRAGDGYADVEAAQAGLQTRIKREPELRWEVEQMPSGKYRLAGYEQGNQSAIPTGSANIQADTVAPVSAAPISDLSIKQPNFDTSPQPVQNPANFEQMPQPQASQPGFTQGSPTPAPTVKPLDMRLIPMSKRAEYATPEAKAIRKGIVALQDGELKQGRLTKFEEVEPAQTADAMLAQKIAEAFQAPITWVRDTRGKTKINAATIGGRLFLNAASSDSPALALAVHEVGHNMPADIKGRMVSAIMETVTPQQRDKFLKDYNYRADSKEIQDEELAMRIIEQDAQKPEFWQRLADKVGSSEFARIAKEILKSLDAILAKFRSQDASQFTTDIQRVRDVVADAYAQTLQRQKGEDVQDAQARPNGEAAPDQASASVRSETRGQPTDIPGAGSGTVEADGVTRLSRQKTEADEQALDYISQQSDVFSLPKSTATDLEGIIADNMPGLTFTKSKFGEQTVYKFTLPDGTPADMTVRPPNPYGPSIYGWDKGPDGEMTNIITERPGENAEEMDGMTDVWIDVSKLSSGEFGQVIYNIASTYAHNNGMVFIGDPNGLSDIALRRRTENMLNSALKFGTTEHLGPHPRQVDGDKAEGVPPLRWIYGDHVGNIERMIDVSIKSAQNADYVQPAADYIPASEAPSRNSARGRLVDSNGSQIGRRDLQAASEFAANREAGIGRRTLARLAVFESLLQRAGASSAEGWRARGGEGILARFASIVREFAVAEPSSRIFYSRQPVATQGQRFTLPEDGATAITRIKLQDDALRMKRVIDAVKEQGGTVGEEQNFYDANTLMPGRVQSMMDDFRTDAVLPMLKKASAADISMDELSLYAYARHAEERNAYIASINPKMQDGGSGMTNADAKAILAEFEKSGKAAEYEDLHADLMGITAATRRTMLDEGLITQEQHDAMDGQYENYMPLRGFENVDAETGAIRPGTGRGINVRGKETIRALGRRSRAGDLIENVIRDYQRAVVKAEKNNVGKVLLDFVMSNPDPDLWGVDVEKGKAAFNKATGQVEYGSTIDKGEDTIGVKVGGQQVYIKIEDKALARALRHAWKDETGDLERAAVVVSGWYNTLLRNVLTRYNPPFALVNTIRDAQSGAVAALDELGAKGAKRFAFYYPKAVAASYRGEQGWGSRTIFKNPVMDRYFNEFKNSGAITGGFFMKDLGDIASDMRSDMLQAGAAPKNLSERARATLAFKVSKKVLGALEFMGTVSENTTRFALYMAARDSGRTPSEAALLAKNGTTNFNRKGEWGGTLNALYLFFNAAVQGNAQLFKTLKNPKVRAAMATVAGIGVAAAMFGASGGGEDDDGQKYWDKIPDYEKERNLIIMLPPGDTLGNGVERVGQYGRYIKIPVQYGLNFFPNIGYMMADVYRNQQDPTSGKTLAKATKHMMSVTFGSVNPFGGSVDVTDSVSVAMALAPTLLDLPIMLGTERNSFGTPVAPSRFPGDNAPDSERMFSSDIGTMPANIAKTLNDLGGGNEAKPGKILGVETSVTPGTIENLIRATTGGLGMFGVQAWDLAAWWTGNQDVRAKGSEPTNWPFLNKMFGEVGTDQNTRLAGDRMREVRAAAKVIKDQIELGIDPEVSEADEKLNELAKAQEQYDKQMRKLRKEEVSILRDTDLTDEKKRLELDNIRALKDELASAVNRAYLEQLGPIKKSDLEVSVTP